MKRLWSAFIVFALILISLTGCAKHTQTDAETTAKDAESASSDSSIVYSNTQYGFDFTLPGSWKGYSIVDSKWEGLSFEGDTGEKVVQTGPMLSIRHPEWTSQKPRQDIPIMIFTLNQWNLLQQEKFHIGPAPIGPSELGRNNKYVFALPARYNFAFPEGYQEVEDILKEKPLQPVQK